MRSETVNYETLSKVSQFVSSSYDLDDTAEHIVHSLTELLGLKGCALMLLDRGTDELRLAAAHGLSRGYLDKGPLSSRRSIAATLTEGPVAIYDVEDDPRLQYPAEAVKEGIRSILSVPLVLRAKPMGVLRLYTAEPWEFLPQDLIFVQAIAEIIALVIDNLRMYKGLKSSIEVLKVLRSGRSKSLKRTLQE